MSLGRFARLLLTLWVVLGAASPAAAQTFTPDLSASGANPLDLAWSGLHFDTMQTQTPVPVAFEYSDAYRTRNKIHHIASFAMLPLFATQVYVGQKLLNEPSNQGLRHLHGTISIAITGLFALNAVTGIWNLVEARKDPHGHTRRTVHGILMLAGQAGFFAAALLTPNHRGPNGIELNTSKKDQHLTLAYASIGVSTAGYLMMLFR